MNYGRNDLLDRTANPAPLGLMGFGMTTILLNLHNARFSGLDAMILSMGIFYGGIAHVIAGIMEWKKGNTFASTAFTSYGMFWLSLVSLVMLPKLSFGFARPAGLSMPAYLGAWVALQVVFGSLTPLFFLLAAGDSLGNHTWRAGRVCSVAHQPSIRAWHRY
jgi:succinate-acetate transporter protein